MFISKDIGYLMKNEYERYHKVFGILYIVIMSTLVRILVSLDIKLYIICIKV